MAHHFNPSELYCILNLLRSHPMGLIEKAGVVPCKAEDPSSAFKVCKSKDVIPFFPAINVFIQDSDHRVGVRRQFGLSLPQYLLCAKLCFLALPANFHLKFRNINILK